MKTWNKATERVTLLLVDAVQQIEEAIDGMSHLNIMRRFMYSTNAVSQWLRWVWITTELVRPQTFTSTVLLDMASLADKVKDEPDLMAVMDRMDWWVMTLKEMALEEHRLPEFDPEAYTYHRKALGDIVRTPVVAAAQYAPSQVPAIDMAVLHLDNGDMYYADDEKVDDKPLGEIALITGARLSRMHANMAEKMDDAMGADTVLAISRLRCKNNSDIVKACYEHKLKQGKDDETNTQTVA